MGIRIGLVELRAQLAHELAALAARIPASVAHVVPPGGLDAGLDALVLDATCPTELAGALRGAPVPVFVVHRPGELELGSALAGRVGSEHVIELPAGGSWLVGRLRPPRAVRALAVVGALGGVGASTAALAAAAAAPGECLLVDADPHSPGAGHALGVGEESARWPAIPSTSSDLDARSLRAALPTSRGLAVLSGCGPEPPDSRLAAVVAAGCSEFGHVVVDCGREASVHLPRGHVVVVVTAAGAHGVRAARRLVGRLGVGVVLVVRGRGSLAAQDVAEQAGADRCLALPELRRAAELADSGDLLSGRTGRRLRQVGESIWEAVA